jgi:hemerythrin superfamily protein
VFAIRSSDDGACNIHCKELAKQAVLAPLRNFANQQHIPSTSQPLKLKEPAMARATHKPSTDAPRDAIALLKQDHRAVEALFEEFEQADESEQSELATRICQMLTVHTQIEEEYLYPQAKDAFGEEDDEMVYEAEIEHGSAKELIGKIEASTPEDPHFKPLMKVLSEYIKHHVKEEEKEMFPSLKETELDLKELGSQMAQRKLELMEQMGIEAEEPASQRKRSGSRATRTSSTKRRQARAGSRSKSARGGSSTRGGSSSRARH